MNTITLPEVQHFEEDFRHYHVLYSELGRIYEGAVYSYQCQVLQDGSFRMTVVTTEGQVVARLSF